MPERSSFLLPHVHSGPSNVSVSTRTPAPRSMEERFKVFPIQQGVHPVSHWNRLVVSHPSPADPMMLLVQGAEQHQQQQQYRRQTCKQSLEALGKVQEEEGVARGDRVLGPDLRHQPQQQPEEIGSGLQFFPPPPPPNHSSATTMTTTTRPFRCDSWRSSSTTLQDGDDKSPQTSRWNLHGGMIGAPQPKFQPAPPKASPVPPSHGRLDLAQLSMVALGEWHRPSESVDREPKRRKKAPNPTFKHSSVPTKRAGYTFHCDNPGCGRSFQRAFHLKRHKAIHTGEKPFVCNVCGKACNRSDNLALHRKTHEKPAYSPQP